jgi:O-antigen/teichoic acid export membrane protein
MLRNVGYNFGARVWFFVITLATTPYLVRGFGAQLFGLYTIMATVGGYFAVLDLGLGVATIKFVAENRGSGDQWALGKTISTAITAYLLLGIVGAAVVTGGATFFVGSVLNVPPELQASATRSLQITGIGLLITMPLSILNSIPVALQRMDITNRRNAVFGTITAIGSVLLVVSGRGIVAVVAFGVLVNALAVVSFGLTTRRLLPDVKLRLGLDRASLRRLGRFGALKFINQIATHSVYHLDKLILAALAPLSVVAVYVIALTLAQRLTTLVGNVASAFFPAASEAHGGDNRDGLIDLYLRGSKFVALFVLPVGMLIVVFADPVLRYWVGAEIANKGSTILIVLTLAYVANAFSTMPAVACDSVSRPGITTAFSVASGSLNVVLVLALTPHLGGIGAALAVLANSVLLVPVFIAYVHKRVLHMRTTELVRRSFIRPAIAAVLVAPVALALRGRVGGLLSLLAALGILLLLYLAITVAIGVYDAVDRSVVAFRFRGKASREPKVAT